MKQALLERGYDSAVVRCTPAAGAHPLSCQAHGVHRDRNGALARCEVGARVDGRRVRLANPVCEQRRPAPPWPQLGLNGVNQFGPGDVALSAGLGTGTSRLFIYWWQIEPLPGVFDFSAYDELYRELVAAGSPPLLTIAGAPTWAQGPHGPCHEAIGCAYPPGPQDNFLWQRMIRTVIAHMPATVGIEVWNEPNLDQAWSPNADPERYAELISLADGAAGQTPEDPPVLFAGLYPAGGAGANHIDPAEFLRRAYAHGLSYDALGIHSYPNLSAGHSFVQRMLNQITALSRVASEHGDHPAMWITELGVSTGGAKTVRTSPSEQAEQLVKLYRAARRTRRIPVVIVHKLRDGPDVDGTQWGYHLGLRYADDTPKPAYCALAEIRDLPCR